MVSLIEQTTRTKFEITLFLEQVFILHFLMFIFQFFIFMPVQNTIRNSYICGADFQMFIFRIILVYKTRHWHYLSYLFFDWRVILFSSKLNTYMMCGLAKFKLAVFIQKRNIDLWFMISSINFWGKNWKVWPRGRTPKTKIFLGKYWSLFCIYPLTFFQFFISPSTYEYKQIVSKLF